MKCITTRVQWAINEIIMRHDIFPRLVIVTALGLAILGVSPVMAQQDGGNGGRREGPPRFELGQVFPPPLLEELKLTSAQQAELELIRKDLKSKLDQLLTDQQKQTIENFRPRGPGRGNGPERNDSPPRGPQREVIDAQRPAISSSSTTVKESAPTAKLKDLPKGTTRVAVVFSGGHETDPGDGGRPVVLIAAALGVKSEVFREAFSRVKPARGGAEPEPGQVRQNKAVLMEALGKYGIDNDTLDTVSNYYRYPPGRGGLWTTKTAVANAIVKNGVVIDYEIISGGSGYSSIPVVSVPDIKGAVAKVEVSYGKSFETNGTVKEISVVP